MTKPENNTHHNESSQVKFSGVPTYSCEMVNVQCAVQPPMPCMTIVIHGVNDNGLAYRNIDNGICKGIVFQLPLLIYFLARMGIVTAAFLRKNRRYAIVLLAIVSAVITPPDVFSLFLVVVPLYSLYEVSILLAARVERAKAREEVEAGSKVE